MLVEVGWPVLPSPVDSPSTWSISLPPAALRSVRLTPNYASKPSAIPPPPSCVQKIGIMEEAKQLIRTAVRTFFPASTKHALIIDGLVYHSICTIEDFYNLTGMQPKEFRQYFQPLRTHRLAHVDQRTGRNVTASVSNSEYSNRSTKRDVYWINYADAVNVIKYRIVKLRRRIENIYQEDKTQQKTWKCPRCKSEYGDLEVFNRFTPEGDFLCEKCGAILKQDTGAVLNGTDNAKIRRLNEQLRKFDVLIEKIDQAVQLNRSALDQTSEAAEARKVEVPDIEHKGNSRRNQWIEMDKPGQKKDLAAIKAEDLQVNITSGAAQEAEERERKEEERKRLAKQNMMPEWHTGSAIEQKNGRTTTTTTDPITGIKTETSANGMLKHEEDEKPVLAQSSGNAAVDKQVLEYLAQMEKEAREAQEAKARESDSDGSEEDDDDDEFEDVEGMGTSVAGTPMSSQGLQPDVGVGNGVGNENNGLKRRVEQDEESSEANTPMPGMISEGPALKKLKIDEEKGPNGITTVPTGEQVDSEEEEFEDV